MDRRPHAKPADRDLKTTLGCLFLMGFEGTTVTPQIRSLIKDYRLGAVLLNATNFVSAEQAVTLIRELQITAHNARHQYPLLIAVDQENGLVKSVTDPRWITQFPSSLGIAATRSTNNAYQLALATGRELSCLGINWILGPALDVVLDRDVPGFGSRSFGDDPEEVAKLGGAFIRGFRDGGVASGAKHFPLGGSLKFDESSTTVPVVFETLEQLRQKVLIPFQEAIKERVDSVMAAGCAISSIGPKFMHACFSRKVVTDLLRHQLGYEGVAVSECLEMESIANHIGVGQATVMGVHAGCDILTICQSLPLQLEAFASLSLALENGALSWDLVQKSVDRVIRLRSTHTSWSHALNPPGLPQLAATRPRHMTLASRIYEESITLVRDDHGYIPLSNVLSDNSTLLILSPILHHRDGGLRSNHQHQESNFPTGEGLQYGEDYFQDFGRAMACYNLGAVLHTSYTSHGVRSEHERLIQKADAIIVLVADANRNQYQLGFAKHVAAISKLQQRTGANPVMEKVLILVSLSSAYDIPADAPFPAHLCTYDSSTIALHCLARVLGGDFKPTGRIPGPQSYPGTQHSHDIVHQQAWLVERFDIARDQVPFRQFLGRLMEADEDSPVISDEHDYVVAIASAGLHPNHGSPDTQHFVIRNTSTGAIYGFASAIRFPELRRGCLGALLVDPEKRELSMGRDLHTSVVRHILQVPGIDSIQIGAPLLALSAGLPMLKDMGLPPSAAFFEKLGWNLKNDTRSLRLCSLVYNKRDQSRGLSACVQEAEAAGILLEVAHGEGSWNNILAHIKDSSISVEPFSSLIYREASTQTDDLIMITARERNSGSLVGSLLLLSRKDTLSSKFPCIFSLPKRTAILLSPILCLRHLNMSSMKTVLQALFCFALLEAQKLRFSSALAYAISIDMVASLEEIGFHGDKLFTMAERPATDFR